MNMGMGFDFWMIPWPFILFYGQFRLKIVSPELMIIFVCNYIPFRIKFVKLLMPNN